MNTCNDALVPVPSYTTDEQADDFTEHTCTQEFDSRNSLRFNDYM